MNEISSSSSTWIGSWMASNNMLWGYITKSMMGRKPLKFWALRPEYESHSMRWSIGIVGSPHKSDSSGRLRLWWALFAKSRSRLCNATNGLVRWRLSCAIQHIQHLPRVNTATVWLASPTKTRSLKYWIDSTFASNVTLALFLPILWETIVHYWKFFNEQMSNLLIYTWQHRNRNRCR